MRFFRNEAGRYLFLAAIVVAAASASLFFTAPESSNVAGAASGLATAAAGPAASFPGVNLGGVADGTSPCWNPGTGAARDVTFNVAGLSGAPTNVSLNMTWGSPNHTFVGDITSVLIAPNGASHTLFGHTLATTATAFGDSSDLGAIYTFSDNAPAPPNGGWWQAATAAGAAALMPTGTYRTTNSGGAGATNPMPATNMSAAFTGVANPNGTWTLRITDSCAGDTGAVTAANLTIDAGPAVPTDANADFNGDGRTDWVIARAGAGALAESIDRTNVLPGQLGYSSLEERPSRSAARRTAEAPEGLPIFWWVQYNNAAGSVVAQLGDAETDFITPEDFDGDEKDDYTVWTEAGPGVANFKVLQSSTNTVAVHVFGQNGDDPAIVGDYDGDNKADPAVFRCPLITDPDGQCYFFFRGSLNNPSGNITYVPWGFGADGDFFPLVGDFDGDDKNDFCIQRSDPAVPTQGQFVLLRSTGGVEYINWGLSADFLIPGDYDGDGRSDIAVRRTVGGQRQHYVLTRTGATIYRTWGITGDSSVPGDYDGDGKTDFAIWRGNTDPSQNLFWVLNSSTGSVTNFEWGQCPTVSTCDFPVAGWAVH
jgi:hypothetical protein